MAFLMSFGMTACSNDVKLFLDQEPVSVIGSDVVKGINVSLANFESAEVQTRTAYSAGEGVLKVTWAAKDTIGIFPNVGTQVEFPLQEGTDSNMATFDGGGWALKASSTYAAYYPLNKANFYRDNKTILLDYTGQKQVANGSATHLGKYDYQATGGVQTNSFGYLNFQFKHLGALMAFHLTVPRAGTYTSLTLYSSAEVFVTKAELDISDDEPVLKPTETSYSITLSLDNIELQENNSELTAYIMLAPADLSHGSLELSLDGTIRYTTSLTGHPLEAGKQYNIDPSMAIVDTSPIIEFADDNVKAICVENWDTNGDGELSMNEASCVKELGLKFKNASIKSFDEFQYFTGVTSTGHQTFRDCSSLTSIVIPEGVTSIGEYVFNNCSSLTTIVIPKGVTSIGSGTFSGCKSLTSIEIPEGVTSIGESVFSDCSSLISIVIPKGVTKIKDKTFYSCSRLVNVELPESLESIGNNAFQACGSLVNIFLPESLTLIGNYAFNNCINLSSLFLPEKMMSIGYRAFYGCSSLNKITCLAYNPPNLEYYFNSYTGGYREQFDNTNSCPIYVLAQSVNTYKVASGWIDYTKRIQPIPDE